VNLNVITTREMQALDANAEYYGISRLQLMENAGRNTAAEIATRFNPKKAKIAVFCGLGGNGGDGFVTARHLACQGFKVTVYLAGKASQITDEAARKNWESLQVLRESVSLHQISDSSLIPDVKANVLVDALLGTGLKGPPRPPISQIIRKINETDAFCVAVDVPSGIDSESGKVLGEAVKADLTVTLHKPKPGLSKAEKYTGQLVVKPIGIPEELEKLTGPGDVKIVVKPRPPESHKGDFGRLLIIGGSETYSGAPALAALAALRTGVDLAVVVSGTNMSVVRRLLEKATAVVMGPGLGLHRETQEAVLNIMKTAEAQKIPLLLDADGLKAFATSKHRIESPAVLTPHAGEYEILTGTKLSQNVQERIENVQRTAQDLDAVVLLKSHVDIVSDGFRVKLNLTGNPGMTVGGTGDVLSGIVGAFLAQGTDPFEAAVAGAFINGAAGDFAVNEKGCHIVASDLLNWIPRVMENPMSHRELKKDFSFGIW